MGALRPNGGVTYKCDEDFSNNNPPCTSLNVNGVWQWAEVYFDANLPSQGIDDRDVHVIAHEIGHVLLLDHHDVLPPYYDNFPLMEGGYVLDEPFQIGPGTTEEGSTSPPCNVKPIADYTLSGIRCIFQYYSSYAPDLIVTAAPGNSSPSEGASPSFLVEVRNQGTSAAGAFAVQLKFNGSARPYPQGVCAFNSGLPVAATQSCITSPVTANFAGGTILATVDYAGQVAESNEGNNTKSVGTLSVVPKSATSLFIAPPYAAYGYTDNSAFENGFGIKLQRKVNTCSGSTGWSTFSQPLNAPLSGTGQAVTIAPFSPVLHGYCYRVKVTTLGPFANSSEKTSSTVWYP